MGRGVGSGDRPEAEGQPFGDATVTTGTAKGPQPEPRATAAPTAESFRFGNKVASPATPPTPNESKPFGQPGGGPTPGESAGSLPKNPVAAPAEPGLPAPSDPYGPARPALGGPQGLSGNQPAGLAPSKPESRFYDAPPVATVKGLETAKSELEKLQEYKKEPQQLTREDKLLQQVNPGIIVQEEEGEKLGIDFADNEKNGKLDQLAQLEGTAKNLNAKDAILVKQRESEVRHKFNRVVALSDELNRERARGDLDQKAVRKKLDDFEIAVREARESEHQYRAVLPQIAGEQYAPIVENAFQSPSTEAHALSTFSIDVDTASYANTRRFLNNGQLPPPDAVRIEELVNYFKYKYPQPKGDDPFSVNMEMADCPWHPGHKLLRVGLQGKEIHRAERPASNIVFLIDTSGSMTDENKLPLLKQGFKMLTSELGENDKVTIVTYAGNAGLKLEPTRGDQKEKIIAAIESLQSGGSTHGSAGITLAYEQAAATFIKGGTNKVILATDGDLNVGITDDASLINLIKQKAETGVFLTVLGVGTGNLKDAKMERLADNGNGVYAYLDSIREARKVLVEEMSGSLVTIAKDVKIQVEFNPAQIQSYRLLGYENRVMANEDFRNDKKDAGEIGAGHNVTAFYEVVMAGEADGKAAVLKPETEKLRYQRTPEVAKPVKELTEEAKSGELLTVFLRYKKPDGDTATEIKFPLKDKGGNFNSASADFQFASAVVAFGLSLRNSEHRGSANLSAVSEIATAAIGEDVGGHRAEFLDLVRRAKSLRGE